MKLLIGNGTKMTLFVWASSRWWRVKQFRQCS